jgi:hypothetical protein
MSPIYTHSPMFILHHLTRHVSLGQRAWRSQAQSLPPVTFHLHFKSIASLLPFISHTRLIGHSMSEVSQHTNGSSTAVVVLPNAVLSEHQNKRHSWNGWRNPRNPQFQPVSFVTQVRQCNTPVSQYNDKQLHYFIWQLSVAISCRTGGRKWQRSVPAVIRTTDT